MSRSGQPYASWCLTEGWRQSRSTSQVHSPHSRGSPPGLLLADFPWALKGRVALINGVSSLFYDAVVLYRFPSSHCTMPGTLRLFNSLPDFSKVDKKQLLAEEAGKVRACFFAVHGLDVQLTRHTHRFRSGKTLFPARLSRSACPRDACTMRHLCSCPFLCASRIPAWSIASC